MEKKLTIHSGEDKTNSIIFGTKRRQQNTHQLNIHRGEVKIKQHTEVKYFGCNFDCYLSGETTALKVLYQINSRLKFLYRKQNVLNVLLKRLLCNPLIQPHFDYASQIWDPNLTKALSKKIQCTQNKCVRFCLNLDNRAHRDKKNRIYNNELVTKK